MDVADGYSFWILSAARPRWQNGGTEFSEAELSPLRQLADPNFLWPHACPVGPTELQTENLLQGWLESNLMNYVYVGCALYIKYEISAL